jgi:hypothetical protein
MFLFKLHMRSLQLHLCFDISSIVDCYFLAGVQFQLAEGLSEDGRGNRPADSSSVSGCSLVVGKPAEDDRVLLDGYFVTWVLLDSLSEDLFLGLVELKIWIHVKIC